MRKILLPGVAFGVLTAIAGQAQAQVQGPGPYISGFGQYLLPSDPEYRVGVLAPSKTDKGDGVGGGLKIGYGFGGGWDVGIDVKTDIFSAGDAVTVFNGRDSAWYVAVDPSVGYTFTWDTTFAVRPALGARGVWWEHHYKENVAGLSERFRGLGPRGTVDASWRFADNWLLIGGIGGGPIFGKVHGKPSTAFPAPSGSQTVWNLDGQIGIGYDFGMVNVVVGWRAEQWWSLHSSQFGFSGGKEDRFAQGPFLRVSYNWGAPPSAAPMAAPPPPPDQIKSFIVFFDFDRANLTATAQQTIRQAAAQAKSGKSTRITVTGHADRAGSDAYNMALSLRRANAVKDQLVREGIGAGSIVVIGKGESQPLVPTADGVREPQNRRVEIVLG
jgi:outer membrane protein OmpA-like peptidoglycan-associated protein